jgi:hypothetical protein
MKIIFGKIRESMDKLFLLALFAAGLGIALYLIQNRRPIELSPPVAIPAEGLSICMPIGPGWKSQAEWAFHRREQSYIIQAQFDAPNNKATLICGFGAYTKEEGTIQERLTQRAAHYKAGIEEVGELRLGNIDMNWVKAVPQQGQFTVFYGAGMAGSDRVVELEVVGQPDPDLARRIFMTVAEGLRYKLRPPSADAPNVTDSFQPAGDDEPLWAAGSTD